MDLIADLFIYLGSSGCMEGKFFVDKFPLYVAEKDAAFENGSQLLYRILLSH